MKKMVLCRTLLKSEFSQSNNALSQRPKQSKTFGRTISTLNSVNFFLIQFILSSPNWKNSSDIVQDEYFYWYTHTCLKHKIP